MKREINQRLLEEVEGTCMGDYGYVVCVTEVNPGKATPVRFLCF